MKIKKYDIIGTALCLLSVLPPICVYSELPEQVPIHFGLDGRPDNFVSKTFAVFAIPLIMTAVQLILSIASSTCEKEGTIPKQMNIFVRMIIPVICFTTQTAITLYCLNSFTNVPLIINCIMGIMFIALGNYLPKCRRNSLVGIRIPPTMKSDYVWEKTHRLAGRIMVIGGFLAVIFGFLGMEVLSLAIISFIVIVPIAYAYIIKENDND